MTDPQPLAFPADHAGWLAFAAERPDARIARVREIDAQLIAGHDLSPLARLQLWNEASIAVAEAASEASLLSESHPDADVRAAAEERVQAIDGLLSRRALDPALFAVFDGLATDGLDAAARRLLAHIQRDFRRGGVDRDEATRERLRRLAERDTELSLQFSRNIRDGRRELKLPADALEGLPQDFIDAHPADDEGLITLTTEYTDLMPVREFAVRRSTRTALLSVYNDLAWPDNDPVLAELLAVRAERAELLGYGDWADYETETRMIGSSAAIRSFLDDIDAATREAATAEYDRLLARLRVDEPDADAVTAADLWYLLSALKREEYAVDAQAVRAYFAFDNVLTGVLDVTARLLDVTYVPVEAGAWHADVRSYDVVRGDRRLGRIHLDLHPREGKYNHAACFNLAPGIAGRSLPEGVLLCNFSRGLLEHDQVVTFFHEFGHLVHGILGGADAVWADFSGIETEWDFVEAPSQLLEEWAWDAGVLATFARDADGEPIPADLVERMRVADAFGRALEVTRQLGHANVSYGLHVERPSDLQAAVEGWYRASSPVHPLPNGHTYAGFGHLTGYGACYYTYQWSLVIARDLLSAFDDDLMDPAVATRYRERILEPGGSRDAADLVADFLGRPYSFDAYRAWLAGA
ncbi:M3 family metallopeptidase [Microbacterium sp. 2P01SA-2]|uniref:M3 family metallopeptidase n=1 Tax=unclassified Microbacterium TaxID=2609290 RepID=UPI0039A14D91